jgi:hypothetical protein
MPGPQKKKKKKKVKESIQVGHSSDNDVYIISAIVCAQVIFILLYWDKNQCKAGHQWLMPVMSAAQEDFGLKPALENS